MVCNEVSSSNVRFRPAYSFNELPEIEIGLASSRCFMDRAAEVILRWEESLPSALTPLCLGGISANEDLLTDALAGFRMLHFTRDDAFIDYAISVAALSYGSRE